jgi:SAM-dependent methyltransferase
MNEKYNYISNKTLDRYNKRYSTFGLDIKTLGWGSENQQKYRFEIACGALDLDGKQILDIGCGFGDLLKFILSEKINIFSYEGWDINPHFIDEAQKFSSNGIFKTKDLIKDDLIKFNLEFDLAIMLGLLNFNYNEEDLNLSFSKDMIRKAFSLVRECLVVDFLSNRLTPDYPKEDFVFYHDPATMLDFALTLTPNVVLKHNYAPIPQREFMLFLYK